MCQACKDVQSYESQSLQFNQKCNVSYIKLISASPSIGFLSEKYVSIRNFKLPIEIQLIISIIVMMIKFLGEEHLYSYST